MTAPTGQRRRGRLKGGQSIIGFTEAELALFIALLIFGLSVLKQAGTAAPIRVAAVPDSLSKENPRVAKLLALAQRLDSLERALRNAYARDSALATQIALLQRQRDSLLALKSSAGSLMLGTKGTSDVPLTQSGRAAVSPLAASLAAQITDVERTIATSSLSRTNASTALATAARQTDSVRLRLDSIAPSLAQALTPTTLLRATRDAMSSAIPGAASVATIASAPLTPRSLSATAGMGAGAVASSYTPAELRRAFQLLATSRLDSTRGGGVASANSAAGTGPGTGANGRSGAGGSRSSTRAIGAIALGAGSGRGRSNQTPTCIELKVDSGAVAEVTILAADRYRVRTVTGPLSTVLEALAPEIASMRKFDCRHRVRVRTGPQLTADDYIVAVNALLPYFNTELARDGSSR